MAFGSVGLAMPALVVIFPPVGGSYITSVAVRNLLLYGMTLFFEHFALGT